MPSPEQTPARRLDHVAVLVRDTEAALRWFRDRLGLPVTHQERNAPAHALLTYLDAGPIALQLVEPLSPASPVHAALAEHGEGLHHLCFAAADVPAAAAELSPDPSLEVRVGSGRGRPSAFVPGEPPHGVPIEFTEG